MATLPPRISTRSRSPASPTPGWELRDRLWGVASVVLDVDGESMRIPIDGDGGVCAGSGVLGDVGQSFLDQSVRRVVDTHVDPLRVPVDLNGDAGTRCPDRLEQSVDVGQSGQRAAGVRAVADRRAVIAQKPE